MIHKSSISKFHVVICSQVWFEKLPVFLKELNVQVPGMQSLKGLFSCEPVDRWEGKPGEIFPDELIEQNPSRKFVNSRWGFSWGEDEVGFPYSGQPHIHCNSCKQGFNFIWGLTGIEPLPVKWRGTTGTTNVVHGSYLREVPM